MWNISLNRWAVVCDCKPGSGNHIIFSHQSSGHVAMASIQPWTLYHAWTSSKLTWLASWLLMAKHTFSYGSLERSDSWFHFSGKGCTALESGPFATYRKRLLWMKIMFVVISHIKAVIFKWASVFQRNLALLDFLPWNLETYTRPGYCRLDYHLSLTVTAVSLPTVLQNCMCLWGILANEC